MVPVELYLQRLGYQTKNIGYPSRRASIAIWHETYLIPELAQQKGPYSLVTHSMGGFDIALTTHTDAASMIFPHSLVMLGPPNAGSEITDRLGSWWLYGLLMGNLPHANCVQTATQRQSDCRDCQIRYTWYHRWESPASFPSHG